MKVNKFNCSEKPNGWDGGVMMCKKEIMHVKIKAKFLNGLCTRWYDLQTDKMF